MLEINYLTNNSLTSYILIHRWASVPKRLRLDNRSSVKALCIVKYRVFEKDFLGGKRQVKKINSFVAYHRCDELIQKSDKIIC